MPFTSKITKFFSPKNLKKRKTSSMDDEEQPCPQFPDTLQGFGYHFKNGELRHIETGEKFQFVVKEADHHYNQLHYEALGKVIEECVYELLEKECGLHRLPVPAWAVLKQGYPPETANQTDDAKAASSSGDRGATGQDAVTTHIPVPQENSIANSDTPAERGSHSENNADSVVSSSDSAGVSIKKSEEQTAKESPDDEMMSAEAGALSSSAPSEHTERSGFMFASEGWNEQEKLIVLIHGSGVVRAGQWARRLIINDNLNTGTQMPFIKEALRLGYGVIVMNTNQNYVVDRNGFSRSIPESESAVAHASHVWLNYVLSSAASSIAVVAHSYGGVVVTHLFQEYKEHFQDKVFAVAFTDSVHCSPLSRTFGYFMKISRNWVTSSEPLDTPLRNRTPRDVPLVSAGVNSHEMTSAASMTSIFKFFEERFNQRFSMDIDEPRQAEHHAVANEELGHVGDERNLSDEDKHEVPRATSINEGSNPPEEPSNGVNETEAVRRGEDGSSELETT